MQEEKTETEQTEVEDNGIEVHSVETDLKMLSDKEESMQESMTTETTEVDESENVEDKPKEDAKEEPKEETKRKSRSQRKIEKQAKELKELREQVQKQESSESKEEADDTPDIDDFETFEEYEKALKVHESEEETEETEGVDPVMDNKVEELFEYGEEDYENFTKLVQAEDLAYSEDMLEFTVNSDKGTDIAYYLATHKDKAREIAGLDHRDMEKALLRIEISLEDGTQKKVQTTKAPKPITPVTGSSATSKSLNDENLSFEEHEALLNAQKMKSAGGFI